MSEQRHEMCCNCGNETGKAGRADDSIYVQSYWPLCERCFDEFRKEIIDAERATPPTGEQATKIRVAEDCLASVLASAECDCIPNKFQCVKHGAMDELRTLRASLAAAHAALKDAMDSWSFDEGQRHTHTWHTREDWYERHETVLRAASEGGRT